MFEVQLTEPKRKPRADQRTLSQPFPVPISSLTDVKANDSIWNWYRGVLNLDENCVEIHDLDEARQIHQMGYFGQFGDPFLTRKRRRADETQENASSSGDGASGKRKKVNAFVILEDIEPSNINNKEGGAGADCIDGEDELDRENTINEGGSQNPDVPPTPNDSPDLEIVSESDGESDSAKGTKSPSTNKDILRLDLAEAFFLSHALGCLVVEEGNEKKELSLDDMFETYSKSKTNAEAFQRRYAVYHHFRSKGWVVKEGLQFGVDFLLYKDGPPFYHASYSVRIQDPESPLTWQALAGLNRVTDASGKELILVNINESKCLPTSAKCSRSKSIKCHPGLHKVREHYSINETLVKRWVSNQERELLGD